MPIYTCTTTQGSLTSAVKALLAAEITRIHADVNHGPPAYVNVVFSRPPASRCPRPGCLRREPTLIGRIRWCRAAEVPGCQCRVQGRGRAFVDHLSG
jgi:phenylpyruvate tautomerase PptA (4-oxalocrotonate tautomerase family)